MSPTQSQYATTSKWELRIKFTQSVTSLSQTTRKTLEAPGLPSNARTFCLLDVLGHPLDALSIAHLSNDTAHEHFNRSHV